MPNYKYINGERTALTDAEEAAFKADLDRLAANRAANDYKRDRVTGIGTTVSGYGSIGEQLDKLYHDINAGKFGADAKTGEWFVGITSVKTAIPKPS
tara:strand:- start:11 stop:301 length:291 start_codon:yes stop_codon:yes gene_type:complete